MHGNRHQRAFQNTYLGRQRTLSIAAATALPPGRLWHPYRVSTPAPAPRVPIPPPHRLTKRARPLQRAPLLISANPPSVGQHAAPSPPTTSQPEPGPATPPTIPHIHRASRGPALNMTQLLKRMAVALRRDTLRNQNNRACRQPTLPAHWPTLIPPSLPICPAPRPILPS